MSLKEMISKFNFDIFMKNIDLILVRLSAEAEYLGLMAERSVWQLPLGQIRFLPKTRGPSYHLKTTQNTQPKSLQNYFFFIYFNGESFKVRDIDEQLYSG